MESTSKVEKANNRLTQVFIGLTLFGLVGSAISTFFKLDPGFIAPITTVLIILLGATIVALGIRNGAAVAALLVVCGGAEVVGVLTGFPFGKYEYTDRWWPTVPLGEHHRYPLLIPFAWLLIVGSCYGIMRSRFTKWSSVFLCAVMATLIDMPMERAMTVVFGYWKWEPVGPIFGAPIQNSIGWFVVSFLAATILAVRDLEIIAKPSWKVLVTFCCFVALTGEISRSDVAWLALMGIASVTLFFAPKS